MKGLVFLGSVIDRGARGLILALWRPLGPLGVAFWRFLGRRGAPKWNLTTVVRKSILFVANPKTKAETSPISSLILTLGTYHFTPHLRCHPQKSRKSGADTTYTTFGARKVVYGGVDTTFTPLHTTFLTPFKCGESGADTTSHHTHHTFCPKFCQKWCPHHYIPHIRCHP